MEEGNQPFDKSVIPFGQCQYPDILSTYGLRTGFSIPFPSIVINHPFIVWRDRHPPRQMRQSQPLLSPSNGVDKLLGWPPRFP